jgi:hypothetical protein
MPIIKIKRNRGRPFAITLPLNPNSFLIIFLTMIINDFFKNITKYSDLGKEIYILPIYGCKFCGYEGMLHRHGYYSRNVITRYYIKRISILRVKCPSCGKTHAILPSFLIPYYQYSLEFIFECLYLSFVMKNSYSKIVNLFNKSNPKLSFCVSNIYSFKRIMRENKSIINSFFTNFDDFYHNMDNPSESSILEKIKSFPRDIFDFNTKYFEIMPSYFFSKS